MRPAILLIEAHSSLLSNMKSPLIDAGFLIRAAADASSAIKAVEEDKPAVIVVGRLPDHLSRFEFCERLRRVAPVTRTRIIILLSRDSERMRVRCLEAGADDYIVEPFHEDALLLRIRSLLRRFDQASTGQRLSYGPLTIDFEQFKVFHGRTMLILRPREFQLLTVFVEHPEVILSRPDICRLAGWRVDSGLARLVDAQVKLLRQALRAGGVPDIIRTVRTSGYRLSAGPGVGPGMPPGSEAGRRGPLQRDA